MAHTPQSPRFPSSLPTSASAHTDRSACSSSSLTALFDIVLDHRIPEGVIVCMANPEQAHAFVAALDAAYAEAFDAVDQGEANTT
jgi:hypothetical protein